MLLYQVAYAVHLFLGIEITCRVVGIAYQYGLCTLINQFLELFHFRKTEAFINGGCHCAYYGASADSQGHIVSISRLWNYDFVSRIETGHEGEKHGLGTSAGDNDVIRRKFNLVSLVI